MVKYMSVDSPSSAIGQKTQAVNLVVKLCCGKMEWFCVAVFVLAGGMQGWLL